MVPGVRARSDVRSGSWQRFDIEQVEDLSNAVFGADLDVVQMPGRRVGGSLAFTAHRGVLFSSGLIDGSVTLYGPLSRDAITIGIGLRFGANSRLWLRPVRNGEVGVVLPGDEHDALLTSGSLYVTATLSTSRLQDEAARLGVPLTQPVSSRTGVYPEPIAESVRTSLLTRVGRLHACGVATPDVSDDVLRAAVEHCARPTASSWVAEARRVSITSDVIVSRARTFITGHLSDSFTLETVATAAGTSQRALARAFVEVLNDTPGDYICRLRLHRIRRDLRSPRATPNSIATIAARWGMTKPARMSGWYREVFGELPGTTLMAAREHWRLANERL